MIMAHMRTTTSEGGGRRLLCSCGKLDVRLPADGPYEMAGALLWDEHVRAALETLDVFKAERRKTGVMTMPELVALVEILREVDGEFRHYEGEYRTAWHNDDPNRVNGGPGRLRERLEDLVGIKRGGLRNA
jgi:hypothetical protein